MCTVDSWHDIAYTSVNIRSAPAVHCVRLLFIVITVNECCTTSHVHAHSGTANCTVGHDCEALLLLGQNACNANCVKETTFSVSSATQNTDWIHCFCNFISTQVIPKKISDHYALLERGYLQYYLYIHAWPISVTECEITYRAWRSQQWRQRIDESCNYEQRKVYCLVDKRTWTLFYTVNVLLCYVNIMVCICVIWFTNLIVSSWSISRFNYCSRIQSDQKQ